MKPTERGKYLVRLAKIIEREAPRLGKLEVKDNGKLLAEMGSQTGYTAKWYRYYGGLASKAKIRDPMLKETNVGPVTTPPQYKKVIDYINIAKAEGAQCIMGGNSYKGEGAKGNQFVEPTIFIGVSNDMRIAQEEVFGPVLSIIPFDTEEEAIKIGNDVNFGLAAGV